MASIASILPGSVSGTVTCISSQAAQSPSIGEELGSLGKFAGNSLFVVAMALKCLYDLDRYRVCNEHIWSAIRD